MINLCSNIDWYLDICANEKRLSADTLKAYGVDLRQFANFAAEKEVDRALLSGYIQELNRKFSPALRNGRLQVYGPSLRNWNTGMSLRTTHLKG